MKYTHTIIILPGFTMDSTDMKYYKDKLNKTFPDFKIKYRILNPPVRKITIYKNEKYNAWYDYLSPQCNEEPEINEEQLLQSRNKIHKILDNEIKYIKDSKKVYLFGYSQGCCMALDAGLTYSKKIGGIIGLKGHVTSKTLKDFKKKQDLLLIHGRSDKTIFYEFSKKSYVKLKNKNPNIKFIAQNNVNHSIPSGIINQMEEINKFII